jgi:hypothetical protein
MKKKELKDLTPKDLSFEELVLLKIKIRRNRPKLKKKLKMEADLLIEMINDELEERGFGKEAELKQSITNPKPRQDERKN